MKTCTCCGVKLTEDNWYEKQRVRRDYICMKCHSFRSNPGRRGGLSWSAWKQTAHPDNFIPLTLAYDPSTWQDDEVVAAMTKKKTRKYQKRFRDHVLSSQRGCLITGIEDRRVLDAAHIKPHVLCLTVAERYDEDNGFPLRRDLHKLFDAGEWTIDQNGWVLVSDKLRPHMQRYCPLGFWTSSKRLALTPGQFRYLEGHRKWAMSENDYSQQEIGNVDIDSRPRSQRVPPCRGHHLAD